MSILALDIGDSRTGVALVRQNSEVVTPLKSLKTADELKGKSELKHLISDYEVELIIIGIPLSKEGEEGSQARHVRSLAAKLLSISGWIRDSREMLDETKIRFFDERLSTKEAEMRLRDYGKSSKESRDYADALAAAVILENYIQYAKGENE